MQHVMLARSKWPRRLLAGGLVALGFTVMVFGFQSRKPLPDGVSYRGDPRPASEIAFLKDVTYLDDRGERQVQQEIFDQILDIIASARRFLVLDMFLYNAFQGPIPETTRALSEELTAALILQKQAFPDMDIVLITDPINTVYGAIVSEPFERLREAGVRVVETDLNALRDSNPMYSFFWRFLVQPFGDGDNQLLPNPFGEGRVSLRSYLRLLNFKANHRKVVAADSPTGLVGLVTSANPHDGSSAHSNIAIRFNGPAVLDLLETENAVLRFSDAARMHTDSMPQGDSSEATVQILTERRIKEEVLRAIEETTAGDRLNLAMFYLSDREVIEAIKQAHQRRVDIRVLLDPNRDAFGRNKNGIPARPVAHELNAQAIPVRWCDTHGEQCHMKMLSIDYEDGSSVLIAGSANFTRRNLENFNLETSVAVRGMAQAAVFSEARDFFESLWNNEPSRHFSADYSAFADRSLFKRMLYQLMERSGISTF